MERHDVLATMTALKLAGMRAAYDDILADGLKRRHPVQQIIGTLLQTEVADKQARSIKYQMTSARLPTAKELADFDFAASPVNEPLIQELAGGDFLESKRNIVLVAAPAPARPISPSPSPAPVSERAPVAAATTSSTWSTTSRPNSAPDAKAVPRTNSSDATSSSSTNSAICPSLRPAASCCST